MTGLDPAKDVIVEIATLITDDDLQIVAEGPDLVVHQSDEALAVMEPFVEEMHTKSGLLDAIKASTISLEDAGRQTLEFIKAHVPAPRTVPLCGNSIGMDRRFLAVYLPEIEEWLHYRSVDVSSVKELARRWHPEVIAKRPFKTGQHRALDDIRESVDRAAVLPRARVPAVTGRPAAAAGTRRRPAPRDGRAHAPGCHRGVTPRRRPSPSVGSVRRMSETAPRPRRQEQEAASDEVTEVAPGVLRLMLPLVGFTGLGHVNCYALEDDRGFALVDPGMMGRPTGSASGTGSTPPASR